MNESNAAVYTGTRCIQPVCICSLIHCDVAGPLIMSEDERHITKNMQCVDKFSCDKIENGDCATFKSHLFFCPTGIGAQTNIFLITFTTILSA